MGKLYESTIVRTGHQAAEDNDFLERENKWGKLYDCLSLLPWKSFQDTVWGGDKAGSPGAKAARVSQSRISNKYHRESSSDLERVPIQSSARNWSAYTYKETTWGEGKD